MAMAQLEKEVAWCSHPSLHMAECREPYNEYFKLKRLIFCAQQILNY
jgi:hypothetical protein